MGYSNGKITKPISITDIKTVLNESSTALSTLSKSNNINIFSKHKPVAIDKSEKLNESDFKAANYGINLDSIYSIGINTAFESAQNSRGFWIPNFSYKRPDKYYRIGDFDGYNHHAVFQFYSIEKPKSFENELNFFPAVQTIGYYNDGTNINIVDLIDTIKYPLNGWFFTVIYKTENNAIAQAFGEENLESVISSGDGHRFFIRWRLFAGTTEGFAMLAFPGETSTTGQYKPTDLNLSPSTNHYILLHGSRFFVDNKVIQIKATVTFDNVPKFSPTLDLGPDNYSYVGGVYTKFGIRPTDTGTIIYTVSSNTSKTISAKLVMHFDCMERLSVKPLISYDEYFIDKNTGNPAEIICSGTEVVHKNITVSPMSIAFPDDIKRKIKRVNITIKLEGPDANKFTIDPSYSQQVYPPKKPVPNPPTV